MEMYTDDTTARGGILEPPGVVEIKFENKYRNQFLLQNLKLC